MKVIEFKHIGKQYRLGTVSTGTFSHDLNRWWTMKILGRQDPYLKIGEANVRSKKGDSDFVWALKDIDFSVEQGDVVGIIGKNGAGKSTLLKLLSRVTAPTVGEIDVRGRIASLLEVGTGFHPEMTGRENIYMNGAIMGMTKAEITRKLDEIIDFSGCERYIDTPVKRYSSGMRVRLGFSVAAHLEPDILVVDEVLAVGDAEFQKKAIGKMQDVSKEQGRTVLFVSHNMAAVRTLCKNGLVLRDGEIVFCGSINDAVSHYLYKPSEDIKCHKITDFIQEKKTFVDIDYIMINGTNNSETIIQTNQKYIEVNIAGTIKEPLKMDLNLVFRTIEGQAMATFSNPIYNKEAPKLEKGRFELNYEIEVPRFVGKGDIMIDLELFEPRTRSFLFAKGCACLHFEGNMNEYYRPIRMKDEGFLGLTAKS